MEESFITKSYAAWPVVMEELKKAKAELNMLANTVMGGVARLSVDDEFRIITASEGYYPMTGYTKVEISRPPICAKALKLVVPEDLPAIVTALEKLAQGDKPISVSYRIRKKDGEIAWNTAYCAKIEQGEHERTMDIFFIDATFSRNRERQLNSLLDNIPVGVVQVEVSNEITITYANGAFYRQIGYTPEEFAGEGIENKIVRVLHPEDRERVSERVRHYIYTDSSHPTLEFRAIKKGGQVLCIQGRAARLSDAAEERRILQCILTDVTEERARQRENAINEERYRIISEQTRDTVFEWNLETDLTQFSPVYEKMFGFVPPTDMCMAQLLDGDIIWGEDRAVVQQMLTDVHSGTPYTETEYRAKKADGSYLWCRNRVTVIFDEYCVPIRAVGVLSDIDDYKKETCNLQERAMRDSLTGLLNRMALEQWVEARLSRRRAGEGHAFLQFDIDHFKQINDFMGHVAGDAALTQIAAHLTARFREGDITGRMGGDEFAVFLSGVFSEEDALARAEQLRNEIRCDFRFGKKLYPLTISIGVSICPKHGTDFQSLYRSADAALYRAKREGGNTVVRCAVEDM